VAAKTHAPVTQAGRKAVSMGLGRFARVALGVAGKVALPLQVASTAYSAYEGYQREGLKGAAVDAGDSLTFGAVGPSERLSGGSDGRLAIAQMAAERSAGRGAYEGARQPPADGSRPEERAADGRPPITGHRRAAR